MLFTLDSLSASLSPCGMLLKIITSFMVYLTLFASAINSWQFTLEIHPYKASCIVTKKYLFYRIKYRTPPRYILTQWYHRYVEYNTYRIQSTGYLKKGQLFKIYFEMFSLSSTWWEIIYNSKNGIIYEARIVLITENNNTAFYFDFVPYCTSKCTSKLCRCFTTFHQYTWSTKSYNIRWWFVLYKKGSTDVCSFKQYFVEILYCWSSVVS